MNLMFSINTGKIPSVSIPQYTSVTVLTNAQVSTATHYWLRPYLSSDFPEFTTTKPYFWIWSTNHNGNAGGLFWGESDDLELTNFSEKGLIIDGHEAETPRLVRIPTEVSGIADELFLSYHTSTKDPDNSGKQQTHLITTSGGDTPSASTWTQRGRVLGIYNGDSHTGYMNFIKRGAADFVALHLSVGGSSPIFYSSVSTTGLSYTRAKKFVLSQGLPDGSTLFEPHQIAPFTYNNTLYGLAMIKTAGVIELGLVTLDSDYHIASLVRIIENTFDYKTLNVRIEGTLAYIYIQGGDNIDRYEDTILWKWDLRNI
jgi:hypothetical protein